MIVRTINAAGGFKATSLVSLKGNILCLRDAQDISNGGIVVQRSNPDRAMRGGRKPRCRRGFGRDGQETLGGRFQQVHSCEHLASRCRALGMAKNLKDPSHRAVFSALHERRLLAFTEWRRKWHWWDAAPKASAMSFVGHMYLRRPVGPIDQRRQGQDDRTSHPRIVMQMLILDGIAMTERVLRQTTARQLSRGFFRSRQEYSL